jgi:hypothetical protein
MRRRDPTRRRARAGSALVPELERVDLSIPDGHRDYDPAPPETLDGLPINHSETHVDFMIGSPDLTVTGV